MSLLNGGEAAGAGLGMGVVPEDAGPVVGVVPVAGADLAEDVVLVGGAVPAGDAERDRYLSSHSDEGRNH